MAHFSCEDRPNWAVWITGAPGVGMNSLGRVLRSRSIDKLAGYRTSHQKETEWIVSIPKLRYHMLDPNCTSRYYHGFMQNLAQVTALPWYRIICLTADRETLGNRVSQYRVTHPITRRDGLSDHQKAEHLYRTQEWMVDYFMASQYSVLILSSSEVRVQDMARTIRALSESGSRINGVIH